MDVQFFASSNPAIPRSARTRRKSKSPEIQAGCSGLIQKGTSPIWLPERMDTTSARGKYLNWYSSNVSAKGEKEFWSRNKLWSPWILLRIVQSLTVYMIQTAWYILVLGGVPDSLKHLMVNRMVYVYFCSEIAVLQCGNMSVVLRVYSLWAQGSPGKDIHIVPLLVF